MANARVLVKRRKVVRNTRKITRTMELVSTAKYRQSFDRVQKAMPYKRTLQEMMQDLAATGGEIDHPLLRRRDPAKHVTVLLLTSNRGLCGGFNSNLCRQALTWLREQGGVDRDLRVVGKKGASFMRFQGAKVDHVYTEFGDRPAYDAVEGLAAELIERYATGATDRVAVVYQRYVSAGLQKPWVDVMLPLSSATGETPDAAGPAVAEASRAAVGDYIFSPSEEELLKVLLPAYVKTSLYHNFLENIVGEHRARMVAMKNATDNAGDFIKTLTRLYNRARQSQITNEISELMGGVEALK
jgi:F-type H+-transporting ATPase subunit gamma